MSSLAVNGRGLLLVNLAVALFGLAGVLGQLTGLPSPLVVLGRATLGGLTLFAIVRVRGVPVRVGRRDLLLLIGQGALLAAHWTTFFQSIAVSGVAIGLLSFATFPLFTAALEPLLIGTTPSRPQIVAALGMGVGVYALVPQFSLDSTAAQGVLWGLLAAATFALLSVLNRRIGRSYSSMVISLYQNGVAAIVLLPVLLVTGIEPVLQPRVLVLLLVLGILCTAGAHTLFIAGLRRMTAQLASLLAGLEPVWGIVFGVLALGEIPTGRSLVGGAIIVGAAMLPAVYAFIARPARPDVRR